MGIKTESKTACFAFFHTLKNLPTTWGLRLTSELLFCFGFGSEKPPHHMGIKTLSASFKVNLMPPLKNLPTTWGLRLFS